MLITCLARTSRLYLRAKFILWKDASSLKVNEWQDDRYQSCSGLEILCPKQYTSFVALIRLTFFIGIFVQNIRVKNVNLKDSCIEE